MENYRFYKKNKQIILTYITLVLLLLNACSSGSLYLMKPIDKTYSINSIQVCETKSSVPIQLDALIQFRTKLDEFLFSDKHFQKGNDIKMEYRCIQAKTPGVWESDSWGSIGERGESLTFEVKYFNDEGEELCVINAECKGSKMKNAAERAASLIAQFTINNFKRK